MAFCLEDSWKDEQPATVDIGAWTGMLVLPMADGVAFTTSKTLAGVRPPETPFQM